MGHIQIIGNIKDKIKMIESSQNEKSPFFGNKIKSFGHFKITKIENISSGQLAAETTSCHYTDWSNWSQDLI